jgi:hypothetical protein
MPRKGEKLITIPCTYCKKNLTISVQDHKKRQKNKNGWMLHFKCVGPMMKSKTQKKMKTFTCVCGTEKTIPLDQYNWRIKQNKSGVLYCSHTCPAKQNASFDHAWKKGSYDRVMKFKKVSPIKVYCSWCKEKNISAFYTTGSLVEIRKNACEGHEKEIRIYLKDHLETWVDSMMYR